VGTANVGTKKLNGKNTSFQKEKSIVKGKDPVCQQPSQVEG